MAKYVIFRKNNVFEDIYTGMKGAAGWGQVQLNESRVRHKVPVEEVPLYMTSRIAGGRPSLLFTRKNGELVEDAVGIRIIHEHLNFWGSMDNFSRFPPPWIFFDLLTFFKF